MTNHQFGGAWTTLKLLALESYMSAYTQALKNQPFTLHYVDAFAGTGKIDQNPSPEAESGIGALFEASIESVRGSATIALENDGFKHYHFNDLKPEHVDELEKIKASHPSKAITISRQDANDFLYGFSRSMKKLDRAVIFIDPYASAVKWETLVYLAETRKVDIWILFPFSTFVRLLPTDLERLPPEWESKITDMLGTNEWRQHLYQKEIIPESTDLFGNVIGEETFHKRLNVTELTEYITERLKTIFPIVEGPIRLTNSKNSTLFHFYFVTANPKASKLASRIAKSVVNKAQQHRF